MRNRLCVAAAAAGLLGCGIATAQTADLDGDGLPETFELRLGFHPDALVNGQVEMRSSIDGTPILTIDGPNAGDGFAFSADFVPDFDGDGFKDIAIAAPRAAMTTDRVGRVYVYSSGDGRLLRTLYGRRGDRLGFFVGEGQDLNLDGVPDIEVDGMALVGRGVPADRRFVFSGATGELLFDQTYPIPGVKEVLVEPIESWGDLNKTSALDGGDVGELVDLVTQGAGPESGGDLNQDDEVDFDDVNLLALAVAAGHPPVDAEDFVLEDWQWNELKSSMDAWTFLYPEDVITASTHPDEWRGQSGATHWWIRGHLRGDGARLISGWMLADNEIVIETQGQRVAAAGASGPGGGGSGGGVEPCMACVEVLNCPSLVRIGEEFTVTADWCADCTDKKWTIQDGTMEDTVFGDSLTYIVDFTEQQLPGVITVTAHCYDPDPGCWRTDSCTITLDDCLLDLEGCPIELREGEGGAFTAIAEPAGGTFTWTLLDFSGVVENFSPSGNTVTFNVKDGLGCFSQVPTVSVLVDYEKDGCHKQRVCQFDVVVDCDDDGVDDRDEGEPGSGSQNCPYWGVWDSDGDCVSDGDEINVYGTDPCLEDTDGDGIEDGFEIKLMNHGTWTWDPVNRQNDPNRDSDHDGLTDLEEAGPNQCSSLFLTDPMNRDTDGDGIWDGCELSEGWDPNDPNDPSNVADDDGDGLTNAQEACSGLNPFDPDTDHDGLWDGIEAVPMSGTDPLDPDTDHDGLLDGDEVYVYGTDPANADTDGDGLDDGFEISCGLDPLSPDTDGNGVLDGDEDLDGDGLSNLDEQDWGTDPQSADTDGDGTSDGEEALNGSDPTDSGDGGSPDIENQAPVTLSISGAPDNVAQWKLVVGEYSVRNTYGGTSTRTYPYARGQAYEIRLSHRGTEPDYYGSTCLQNFAYTATVEVDPAFEGCWSIRDPDGLLGVHNPPDCYDSHDCNPAEGKVAYLVIDPIDLDVDSDNTDGLLPPARTGGEDAIEDDASIAGKIVMVNDGDSDADGIPDYADGYDFDPSMADDDLTEGELFVPIVLEVAYLEDPDNARVQFQYSASDPALLQVSADPNSIDPPVYTPAPGALRLWLKPGDQPRSSLPVPDGDFVAPGTDYLLGELGLDPQTGGEIILYAEAVVASATQGDMRIEVDVSGQDCGTDAVRLTAIGTRFVEVLPDGSLQPVLHPEVSEPTPTIDVAGFAVTNIRTSSDHSRILADLTFSGTVDDQASDLIPGPEGVIEWLNFRLNGNPVAPDGMPIYDGNPTQPLTIPLQYNKLSTPGGVLEQYDYSGSFSTTLVGIEIGVGLNRVELLATNAYGFQGYAAGTFSIGFTEPPVDSGAIDLAYDFSLADPFSNDPNDIVPFSYWVNGQMFEADLSPALGGSDPGLWMDPEQTMRTRVLDGAVFTPDEPDVWDLEVTTPDGRLVDDWIVHLETDFDSREFTARRVFEDYERPDWEGFDLFLESIDNPWEFLRSDGGMLHPVLLEVVGPPQVKAMLQSIQLGGAGSTEYLLTTDGDGRTFLADEESLAAGLPRPLLILPHNALSGDPDDGDEEARNGLGNFARGFGTGVVDTGVGIWDGVKFIGKRAWYQVKYYNPISIVVRIADGGSYLTVEDQQTISVAWAAASEVAEFVWLIMQDQQDFMDALMTGDVEELNRLGEKYALVLEYSAEIIQAIADELVGLDDYEKGRIVGRIVGEVAVTLATAGAAQAAKAGAIANAVQRVRQVSYVQRYPAIVNKLDDLAAFISYLSRSHICFVAGTPVLTDSGLVPIEHLKPGDLVLARDERTGHEAYRPVRYTIFTHPTELYHIIITREGGDTERIITTAEHPFYVAASRSFVPARELAIGDALTRAGSVGTTAHITDIQVQRGPPKPGQERHGWDGGAYRTYNIEVAEFHSYFVGRAAVWVHNQGVGRADCERVAAVYHRLRSKDQLDPWDAFEKLMTLTASPTRRPRFDPHLRYAVREITLDMFDTANGGQVKSVTAMRGYTGNQPRLSAGYIEVNHSVPIYVQKRITGFPQNVLDGCPGMLLHWQDHRISHPNRPNSFHTILNRYIPSHPSRFNTMFPNGLSREEAKFQLGRAYTEWITANNLFDPSTDHAANIKAAINAWIDNPTP